MSKKNQDIVFVVSKHGRPLMPTRKRGMVRHLMEEGKAVPICNEPFTIRLKIETTSYTQDLYEGVDPGRENVGDAVSTEDGECILQVNVKPHTTKVACFPVNNTTCTNGIHAMRLTPLESGDYLTDNTV